MTRGLLIAFEGGEGTGKSTQAALFAKEIDALLTREPGGTPFGERVRELFQLETNMIIGARAEALLVASSRAQHVEDVIEPALGSGKNVVTDRYIASSIAYQGYARGLDINDLISINDWASYGVKADVTILIDVPTEVVLKRLDGVVSDRFELEEEEFHERVAHGYHSLAEANPESWIVIDGNAEIQTVADRVNSAFNLWKAKHDIHV